MEGVRTQTGLCGPRDAAWEALTPPMDSQVSKCQLLVSVFNTNVVECLPDTIWGCYNSI
jgi:hypothetical protein